MTSPFSPRPSLPATASRLLLATPLRWSALACALALAGCGHGGGKPPAATSAQAGPAARVEGSRASGVHAADGRVSQVDSSVQGSGASRLDYDADDSGEGDRGSSRSSQHADAQSDAGQSRNSEQALPAKPNDALEATLRLLANVPALRQQAIDRMDKLGLQAYFVAHDLGSTQAAEQGLQQLKSELASLPGFPRIGGALSLRDLWAPSSSDGRPGLGLHASSVVSRQALAESLLDGRSPAVDTYAVYRLAVGEVDGTATRGPVSYDWLPHHPRLHALIYRSGQQHIAYVRNDGGWHRLHGSRVEPVSDHSLRELPIAEGQGFELAVYRHPGVGAAEDDEQAHSFTFGRNSIDSAAEDDEQAHSFTFGRNSIDSAADDPDKLPSSMDRQSDGPVSPDPQTLRGGSLQQIEAQHHVPGEPRGLRDQGGSSVFNALLQLLVHDQELGRNAAARLPGLALQDFYTAYQSGSRLALDGAVERVVAALRAGWLQPGGSAAVDLVDGWMAEPADDTSQQRSGLGLPLRQVAYPLGIVRDLEGRRQRVFAFAKMNAEGEMLPMKVAYDWLPDPQRLHALVYLEPGDRYTVYLRDGDGWRGMRDDQLGRFADAELQALPVNADSGFCMAIYRKGQVADPQTRVTAQDEQASNRGSPGNQGSRKKGTRALFLRTHEVFERSGADPAERNARTVAPAEQPPLHPLPYADRGQQLLACALQLIGRDATLRQQAIDQRRDLPLREFFAAYDSGERMAMARSWGEVLRGFDLRAGSSDYRNVGLPQLWELAAGGRSPGLGLQQQTIYDAQQMRKYLQQPGPAVLAFQVRNHDLLTTRGPVAYRWLEDRQRLSALVYTTGLRRGEPSSTVFVRWQDDWYALGPASVTRVSEGALAQLSADEDRGFEMAIYQAA